MNFLDWFHQDNALTFFSGVSGAAAMAATDWRTPWRVVQHVFVGTAASAIATPVFAPVISKVLGFFTVDPSAHQNASAFIVGAFAIYILEFSLAFWRAKTKLAGKPDKGGRDQ